MVVPSPAMATSQAHGWREKSESKTASGSDHVVAPGRSRADSTESPPPQTAVTMPSGAAATTGARHPTDVAEIRSIVGSNGVAVNGPDRERRGQDSAPPASRPQGTTAPPSRKGASATLA